MNISLENPYGSVTIPRAHLRTSEENSTVIINPMALEHNNSANPYGTLEAKNGTQNPPPYGGEGSYTVKVDNEEVGSSNACCRRCRRK